MPEKWEGAAEENHRSPLGTSSFSQKNMLCVTAATAYCYEGDRRRLRLLIKDIKTRSKTLWLGQKDIRQLKQRQLLANTPSPLPPQSSVAECGLSSGYTDTVYMRNNPVKDPACEGTSLSAGQHPVQVCGWSATCAERCQSWGWVCQEAARATCNLKLSVFPGDQVCTGIC